MMKASAKVFLLLTMLLLAFGLLAGCGNKEESSTLSLTNVSYDPTREFYEAYNKLFAAYWLDETGEAVSISQSHGGSGSQAMTVANGLKADVVTLALEADISSIETAGLIEQGWQNEFENSSAPYTSTIVFLVRAGNPKNIADWGNLTSGDVGIITPNPKTSGAARWNFLAAWAWAEREYDNDEAEVMQFISQLYSNVLVLDSGARGSTSTFCENGQGDVLLSWENEAFLTLQLYPDEYEIVYPSISILCQPSVAVVDEVVEERGSRELAEAYLAYLYTDEAQQLAGEHYYRPSNLQILQQFSELFNLEMELITIEHFGGWAEAQSKYFADKGIFDQIYE